ncbi:MAG TPA: hypothetical protein VJU87_06600 [Gemmatimonadaceae bacterium]|nr:hypothetical protein [Gemmatimonadaceae bacterium]
MPSTRRAIRPPRSRRADAVRDVQRELDAWRARALPDPEAPLETEDIARLVRDCLHALAMDAAVGEGFSVNTVHYYRRKDILDAPEGRTSAARYGVRHLWQAVGARLAGYLGLVTLAEAREVMRGADEPALTRFLAQRVLDARARQAARQAPLRVGATHREAIARPIGHGVARTSSASTGGTLIALPGEAWCVLPASHPAQHSAAAARDLVRAFAAALHLPADAAGEP